MLLNQQRSNSLYIEQNMGEIRQAGQHHTEAHFRWSMFVGVIFQNESKNKCLNYKAKTENACNIQQLGQHLWINK